MTDDFISSILSGDRRAIAKSISMIENEDSKISNIISEIYPKTGGSECISRSCGIVELTLRRHCRG